MRRILLAIACFALATVPVVAYAVWIYAAWLNEASPFLGAPEISVLIVVISVFLWLPQTICIWSLWFFVFREKRGNLRARSIRRDPQADVASERQAS